MEDNRRMPPESRYPTEHRRYVYRSVKPDTGESHPLRRSTDIPHPYQHASTQFCPKLEFLQFRVYLKIN